LCGITASYTGRTTPTRSYDERYRQPLGHHDGERPAVPPSRAISKKRRREAIMYDPSQAAAKRSRNVGIVYTSGTSHPPGRDVSVRVLADDAGAQRFRAATSGSSAPVFKQPQDSCRPGEDRRHRLVSTGRNDSVRGRHTGQSGREQKQPVRPHPPCLHPTPCAYKHYMKCTDGHR